MAVSVQNVENLDDKVPHILVQLYQTPHCLFQVFHKPTYPGERFTVSPDVEIHHEQSWGVSGFLSEPANLKEGILEVFAELYLDEEDPAVYYPDDLEDADPYATIVYDPEGEVYRAEPVLEMQGDTLDAIASDAIASSSIDGAILQTVEVLDAWMDRETIAGR